MPTWPASKPVTTTTDDPSDSISGARGDINLAITNVNTITDFFNLGTPGSGDDNKVLTYDHSTGFIVLETATGGGGNPLTADLDVDNFSIVNTTDGTSTNRGNAFKIGTESGTQYDKTNLVSLPAGFDVSGGGGDRICGPVDIMVVDDFNTWNERIHSMPSLFKTSLSADYGEPGAPSSERGATRIRNRYTESILDTASYDWGDGNVRFGDGLISQFITSKIYNSVASTSSTATSTTTLLAAPQSDGNVGNQTVTHMRGTLVQPFLDSNATVTNLYGFEYNTGNISGTVSNHYSFSSTDSNAQFVNAGPAILKGLTYPTSDGSSGQVIKTDGSGTLSFGDVSQGTAGSHTITSPTGTSETLTADRNNGMVQYMDVDSNVIDLMIAQPSNMVAGDTLILVLEGNRAGGHNLKWQGIYNAYGTGSFGLNINQVQRITIVRDASGYTSITSGNLAAGN